jgi:hypothetical protein
MKKVIILIILAAAGTFYQGCTKETTEEQNLNGWHLMGDFRDSCMIGTDTAKYNNQTVYFIKSNSSDKDAIGTAANNLDPERYLGKRVRLSGFIKTENSDKFTQMFMRVNGGTGDGFSGKTLSYDDMQKRPINGTTGWQKYEIVLDVPGEAKSILYGVHVFGKGEAWFSGITFDVVGNDVPTTDLFKK